MNKQEFLDALRRELAALPADELDEAIRYYDEYISEAGAEGDVTALMGSPQKVAEDFKKEYYDKKPVTGGELVSKNAYTQTAEAGGRRKAPVWLYVLLGILIIGFGMPIVRGVLHRLPSLLCVLVVLALIAIVIKILRDRNSSGNAVVRAAGGETCSDISSVNMKLGAGKYVLRKGTSFGIDGEGIGSFIRGGVWYIDAENSGGIISVTVPEGFAAKELFVNLGAGDLLIKDITSYSACVNVGVGRAETENVFAQKADIKCGTGSVKADLSVNGGVDVKCGAGSVEINLKNPQSDFNRHASVGLGRVTIGDRTITASGKIDENTGAFHNINADCGMGEIKITFA